MDNCRPASKCSTPESTIRYVCLNCVQLVTVKYNRNPTESVPLCPKQPGHDNNNNKIIITCLVDTSPERLESENSS